MMTPPAEGTSPFKEYPQDPSNNTPVPKTRPSIDFQTAAAKIKEKRAEQSGDVTTVRASQQQIETSQQIPAIPTTTEDTTQLNEADIPNKDEMQELTTEVSETIQTEIANELGIHPENLDLSNLPSVVIENVNEFTRNSENELLVTGTDSNGNEHQLSFKQAAVFAGIITATLFSGKETSSIFRSVAKLASSDLGKKVVASINLPDEMKDIILELGRTYSQDWLNNIEINDLETFLDKLEPEQLFELLSNIDENTRKKLLSGENFSGSIFNKKQLDVQFLEKIYNKLSEQQRLSLDFTHPAATQQLAA